MNVPTLPFRRSGFRACLRGALLLASLSTWNASAEAKLTIKISEESGFSTVIADNEIGDNNLTLGAIDLDVSNVLNPFLADYEFVNFGASSNGGGVIGPSPIGSAVLTQGGSILRKATSNGLQSIVIEVSDNGYLLPTNNPKFLDSSGVTTFVGGRTGDFRTFQSAFDAGDRLFTPTQTSTGFEHDASSAPPGIPPDAHLQSFSTNEPSLPLGSHPTPFSLTNISTINLAAGGATALKRIQIQGATSVANRITVVPEPGALATVSSGAIGLLVFRRFRGKNGRLFGLPALVAPSANQIS